MNLSAKIFFLIAITFLFHVEAQQNKFIQTFSTPDSVQVKARLIDSLMKIASGPSKAFGPFMKIYAYDHPGIGTYIVSLNDVNGDGFNDFAVSTSTDTTFIFFGGPNMDDKPDAFVLGGGGGLIAGDINGDGYTDIITSQADNQGILDPDLKGLVRIYLHNKTSSMYNTQSDLQLVGRNKKSGLGYYGLIKGGDLNNDDKLDLVIWSNDLNGSQHGVLYLYIGKTIPDTIPNYEFKDWKTGITRANYGEVFQIVDINGDGYPDLLIRGLTPNPGKNIVDYAIYLGNNTASYNLLPDRVISGFGDETVNLEFVDMNGDGCPELRYSGGEKDPPFCWGYSGNDFWTKQDFRADTVLINEDPDILRNAARFKQIGNFLGTGYKDYVVIWLVQFMNQIIGATEYLYRGGPGWQPKAIAYYGVSADRDGVDPTPRNIGDITGDGLDDFALISGYYNPADVRFFAPIWLFKGDKTFIKTSIDQSLSPDDFHLKIFPNPIFIGKENKVTIQGESSEIGEIKLILSDVLGREVKREKRELYHHGAFQFQLDVSKLTTGVYFITVNTNMKKTIKSISIINN